MTATPRVFDARACTLGEGPFWHPLRQQLFWFDIVSRRLLSRLGDQALEWRLDRMASAAGWIDHDHLLLASETGLSRFNLVTGSEETLCAIELDNSMNRSNDGRADPWGGFWLGTMSKTGEAQKGALYRWVPGELRMIETGISTPNSICFDAIRACAYYTDTKTRIIWRLPIDPATGWPAGDKQVFLDLRATASRPEHKPDGAVIDAEGCLWSAQWGSARVARYDPEGRFMAAFALPTGHTSCPAFGGADLGTLFVTTAREKLPEDKPEWRPGAGQVYALFPGVYGLAEPQVIV